MNKGMSRVMKDCQMEAIQMCKEITTETGFEYPKESVTSLGVTFFIEDARARKGNY